MSSSFTKIKLDLEKAFVFVQGFLQIFFSLNNRLLESCFKAIRVKRKCVPGVMKSTQKVKNKQKLVWYNYRSSQPRYCLSKQTNFSQTLRAQLTTHKRKGHTWSFFVSSSFCYHTPLLALLSYVKMKKERGKELTLMQNFQTCVI